MLAFVMAGMTSQFWKPPSRTAIVIPLPFIPMLCNRCPCSISICSLPLPYISPLMLSQGFQLSWWLNLGVSLLMESGDVHTFRTSFTHGSVLRRFRSVVSFERTSTELCHLLVPIMTHSVDFFRSSLTVSLAVFSKVFRYCGLTGRSVESMGSPCLLRRSMLLCESQREGCSME